MIIKRLQLRTPATGAIRIIIQSLIMWRSQLRTHASSIALLAVDSPTPSEGFLLLRLSARCGVETHATDAD